MNISRITLDNFDAVVAVTQNSINETLAEFLAQVNPQITLYYAIQDGLPFPVDDAAKANFIFKGTLNLNFDAMGNPIDIVVLNTGTPNTVLYNMTFSDASFELKFDNLKFKTTQSEQPWIISFRVALEYTDAAISDLPAETQKTVNTVTQNLGFNNFNIQRLYFDLNNVQVDSLQNITGLIPPAEIELKLIMSQYLASLQKVNGNLVGYWVLYFSPTIPPPSFIPTGINFCVTPYTGSDGKHSNPGLDTLNYLVTTNNRPMPPVPNGFGFNWVGNENLQGRMAVANRVYVENLIQVIDGILPAISPVPYAHSNDDKDADDQDIGFNANSSAPGQRSVFNPPQNGVFLEYSYSNRAFNQSGHFGGASAELKIASYCKAAYDGQKVKIEGSFAVSAQGSTVDAFGGTQIATMPEATYAWSVELLLKIVSKSQDQNKPQYQVLTYSIQNQDFDSPPTYAPDNESLWDKIISDEGSFSTFAENPDNIRGNLEQNVENTIIPALQTSIQNAGHFIFPGGQTFLFSDATLTPTGDLVANITYLAPGATEKGATA